MSEEKNKSVEDAIETVLGNDVELAEVDAVEESITEETNLIEELSAKLVLAEDALKEQKDLVVRAQAFAQNEIRKAGLDAENRRKSVLKTFANALTPVVDILELAIVHADKDNEALKPMLDGVEMTLTELLKAIASIGIQQINPVGEALNPEKHQAITMQYVEGVAANQVISVMQKGYELSGGQVIRPAMVVVAKAAE